MTSSSPLIRFDGRTRSVLAALFLILVVGTVFKLHGSSIGVWNSILSDATQDDGILLGTPKVVRIDEPVQVEYGDGKPFGEK